jgi:hypothetical protein
MAETARALAEMSVAQRQLADVHKHLIGGFLAGPQ